MIANRTFLSSSRKSRAQRAGGSGGLPPKRIKIDRGPSVLEQQRWPSNSAHAPLPCPFPRAAGALEKSTADRSNHFAIVVRSRRTLWYERLRAPTATNKRCSCAFVMFVAAFVAHARERERTKALREEYSRRGGGSFAATSQAPTRASADSAAQPGVMKGARFVIRAPERL